MLFTGESRPLNSYKGTVHDILRTTNTQIKNAAGWLSEPQVVQLATPSQNAWAAGMNNKCAPCFSAPVSLPLAPDNSRVFLTQKFPVANQH